MSRAIAKQVESLRQAAVDYALGSIADAVRQASLLKIPFPEVLSAMAGADASITCPVHGPHRKSSASMKAADRLEELITDDVEFAKQNLIRGARELRTFGFDLAKLQQFMENHINCDHPDHDRGHDHTHTHAGADTGDHVEPATEPRPIRLVM
jgi:hypothetical protein